MWLYLDQDTDLFSRPQRVLHVAPEPFLQQKLRSVHGSGYDYGDIGDPAHHVDVTDLPYPDDSFDVAICSHVFEHVPEDARAVREFARVLAPHGWAILDAPVDVRRATTYEDHRITSPKMRRRHFGQWDHVRVYGRDYPELLRDGGFVVQVDPRAISERDASHYGLRPGVDRLYVCRHSASRPQVGPGLDAQG